MASQSIVYHNESYSSTKKENSSLCPDWLPIYSKKQFMTEHNFAADKIPLNEIGPVESCAMANCAYCEDLNYCLTCDPGYYVD